jgi:hypothetical protein
VHRNIFCINHNALAYRKICRCVNGRHDIQHNDIQDNDTPHTNKKRDTRHNDIQHYVMSLETVMLRVANKPFYAECRSAECRGAVYMWLYNKLITSLRSMHHTGSCFIKNFMYVALRPVQTEANGTICCTLNHKK